MKRALDGIVIIEFGHSVAAPYAGLILADLGARVIKVESPGKGDYARGWGPPFFEEDATIFHSLNRGKESITVDFSDPAQAQALRRLIVEEADMVIQNLRHGVLAKHELDETHLRALKPELLWADIGAFGTEGPLAAKPGYDPLMQASTGIMSITGENGRPPVRVGVSLVDMGSGMWAVIGLLAALLQRRAGGAGAGVQTSLYETGLAWMTPPLVGYAAAGDVRQPHGSGTAEIVPYQAFETKTGWLMVAAGNDRLFAKLVKALGLPDLAENLDFATNAGRVRGRAGLIARLAQAIAGWTMEDLAAALDAVGVPNAPILTADQVFSHPQTAAVGMIAPTNGLPLAGIPIRFDSERHRSELPAPKLGEHQTILNRNPA